MSAEKEITFGELVKNGLLDGVSQVIFGETGVCLSWYEEMDVLYTGNDDIEGVEDNVFIFETLNGHIFKIRENSPVQFDGLDLVVCEGNTRSETYVSFQKLIDIDPETFINKEK